MTVWTLGGRRLRVALRQMLDAGDSQDALAERLGYSQSAIAQWSAGKVCPKQDKIERFAEAFNIRSDFFTDVSLGEAPDHRRFLGRETHVDRDDAKGTPNAEAYIAAMMVKGEPVSEEHARRLRSVRMSEGDMPLGAFELAHRSMLAEDAGRALPPRPGPAGKVDEERGQRKLPPSTKKVR